ncbi:MAG: FAD-dependent oxidoreductase [Gemmataceae bacterium]
MYRRRFLSIAGGFGVAAFVPTLEAADNAELSADVVVVGGGLGGCAAALGALRAGATVLLSEETAWLGGQMTAQAVPPDENRWIETRGCTKAYRQLREGIRDVYRQRSDPALLPAFRGRKELNPGNGWVSRLCCEPRVALTVLERMLEPHVASKQLRILRHWKPTAVDGDGDRVHAVVGRDTRSGNRQTLRGKFILDATEQGDLLPLAKAEHVTGAESQAQTGEPNAMHEARPHVIQSFTVCFALEYRDGQDHTIEKPAEYDFWRGYEPQLTPPYSGKLFSWNYPSNANRKFGFDPVNGRTPEGPNLWTYRRILDRSLYAPGAVGGDISIINWHQNDYYLGPLIAVAPEEAAKNLARAKQQSLSTLYWLQTEAPRSDGKQGWKGLKLRGDLLGSDDGLALYPYIRESRRIKAEFTVLEQHVGKQLRMKETKLPADKVRAAQFDDSVGIGHYTMDLHPRTGGYNGTGYETLPFQIPLGAILPIRMENLLPACKNLGVTHLTNGCYRLHPIEWNVGEAAGALAGFCLSRGEVARRVRSNPALLADFQKVLLNGGVELTWPDPLT